MSVIPVVPFASAGRLFECEVFTLKSLLDRHLDAQVHRLQFYLVILITQGQGRHIIDFNSYSYQPGTLLFIAENQVQQFQPDPASDGFLLLFTKTFFCQTAQDALLLDQSCLFDAFLQSPTLELDPANQALFDFLFERLEFEQVSTRPFQEALMRTLLRLLLLEAETLKRETGPAPLLPGQGEFARFRAQLEQSFSQTRRVEDYAQMLGISTRKLNQLVTEATAKTAKEFIDERIILEIRRLLAHSDLSVKEIAAQLGFEEPTYLTKFFKRYTGQTPLLFRARFK